MGAKLDWKIGKDEDVELSWRGLATDARKRVSLPDGILFSPENPEVMRLWIKSRYLVIDSYSWHHFFLSLIVFGLLAMYFFI